MGLKEKLLQLEQRTLIKDIVPFGLCSYESNAMKSSNPYSGCYKAKASKTLDVSGLNPTCRQGGVLIVEIYKQQEG